jgi:hypothetical protein
MGIEAVVAVHDGFDVLEDRPGVGLAADAMRHVAQFDRMKGRPARQFAAFVDRLEEAGLSFGGLRHERIHRR